MAQPVKRITILNGQPFWIGSAVRARTNGRYQTYYLPCFTVDNYMEVGNIPIKLHLCLSLESDDWRISFGWVLVDVTYSSDFNYLLEFSVDLLPHLLEPGNKLFRTVTFKFLFMGKSDIICIRCKPEVCKFPKNSIIFQLWSFLGNSAS